MADDVDYGNLIYKRGDSVEVYAGFLRSENKPVCIKVLYADVLDEANGILIETFNMMRFKDQPNIVTIYHTQISKSENRYFVRVIMEYFPLGDLNSLIKQQSSPFPEEKLLSFLKQLVSAFAYLEGKKVAHRDIKPENIFVKDPNTLIVGDLGSAREKEKNYSETIAGTPMYLSPEVRLAYIENLQGHSSNSLRYDPYKSDVYSLGLTMLYMASLFPLKDLLNLPNLEAKTKGRIDQLVMYPKLQVYLREMLAFSAENRPNFTELFKKMGNEQESTISFCTACMRKIDGDYYFFESSEKICENCYNSINQLLWNSNNR